jgi:hypothetical protein
MTGSHASRRSRVHSSSQSIISDVDPANGFAENYPLD